VLYLLRAFRPWQSIARPNQNTPDFLVIFKLQIGPANDVVGVSAVFEHQNGVHAVFADHGGFPHAR
jgi:uncharacterized protein YukJ